MIFCLCLPQIYSLSGMLLMIIDKFYTTFNELFLITSYIKVIHFVNEKVLHYMT